MTAEPLPCPMCGTLVEVVSSGEGTNSYRPVARTADRDDRCAVRSV